MAFGLADALTNGYSLDRIAHNFVRWFDDGVWSAHGRVFDIGIATSDAIVGLKKGVSPLRSGGTHENSNGNGSLMRTLPVVFAIDNLDIHARFQCVADVSGITHRHIRSKLSCFIYTEYARLLFAGAEKHNAFQNMKQIVNDFLIAGSICSEEEIHKFHRILENPYGDYEIRPLLDYKEKELSSGGYCVSTLEASLWCFLKYDNYKDAVLAAVNLGDDADTTGCVTGGLAGLYYGYSSIPEQWVNVLARRDDIVNLANRLSEAAGR
jgi:ADP-ribosylglycohydrolase